MPPRPIIATARLDERAFAFFDGLRRKHFPPKRNLIPAHLTLFHHLPGEDPEQVRHVVETVCRRFLTPSGRVTKVISLGKGVAFRLEIPGLGRIRDRIADAFRDDLTKQDQQPLRAHVTVQNKVEPAVAKQTLARLREEFEPFDLRVVGVDLWYYEGGPWTPFTFVECQEEPEA